MSSYNLIPFTDLTATGFTNAVVTTSFTVNSFTVADSTGADANQFVALAIGSPTAPPFTFDVDQRAGMWASTSGFASLSFSIQGTTVGGVRIRTATPEWMLHIGGATSGVALSEFSGNTFKVTDANNGFTTASMVAQNLALKFISGGGETGLITSDNTKAFSVFGSGGANASFATVRVAAGAVVPTAAGSHWTQEAGAPGTHYHKPGILQQATTTITPSTARSGAHITNLLSGIATLFVTLPTSVAGLKYTISNARTVANTVVINPVAADTLSVFGLIKAAGASVAANAPFSSITFHCITSTMWLATKKTGTWT